MKKTFLIIFAIALIIGSELIAKPRFGVSFNYFYSSLRPYGEWIELDADLYGWRPMHTSRNWKPYMHGRWSWTNYGWYWDSYEPYGWAVYHYGRWHFDDYYGWIWIPDDEWGPAWVEWRYNDDYVGWAPLPPYASFSINFGIRFSIGWSASYNWWNFVHYDRFCDHRLGRYLLDYRRTSRIFGSTKYRNNYYYDRDRIVNGGLDRRFIEERGGYRISEREVNNVEDRREFNRLRERDSDRIYNYKPSENETSRFRNDEKFEVRRGERSINLEKDRVTTPRISERNFAERNERTRGEISDRALPNNDERKLDRGRIESERERERTITREREEILKKENEERNIQRQRDESIRRENEERATRQREEIQRRENEQRERQEKDFRRQREEERRRETMQRESERERSRSFERQQERRVEPERRVESRRETPSTERRESPRVDSRSSESRPESGRTVERRR